MDRKEKALYFKHNGCNCSQAVAMAFADLTDYDEETIKKLTTGFGLGGGTMLGTCGALSGVYLINSLVLEKKHAGEKNLKGIVYAANKEITKKFLKKNKAVICKELKGVETGEMLRSCDGCVEDAAEFLSEYIDKL